MMKKVILSLVFIMATGSILNANSINQVYVFKESCFEKADRLATKAGIRLDLDLGQEHELFGILYDDCRG